MKGELDLMPAVESIAGELASIPSTDTVDGEFGKEKQLLSNLKKATLMVAGKAVEKLMQSLAKEQEVLMNIADMLIDVYIAESLMLRVMKINSTDKDKAGVFKDMLAVFMVDAADRINKNGKDAISSYAEGDEMNLLMMGLKRFTKYSPINVKEARRKIAAMLIDKNAYCF